MIKVDKNKCIGCGYCVSICKDIFEIGEDGKARVKAQKELPCVKEAIESCPAQAISQ